MKERRTRKLIMYGLMIALMLTTVAYAVLQTTLNISGTVTKKGGSWDIHFANLSSPTLTGDASSANANIQATSFTFSATVVKPKDSIVYTFDVVNGGSIDATLSSITLTGATEAKAQDITYTLTYADGKTITKGDTLTSGQTRSLKLTVSYDDVDTISSTSDITLNLGATLIYVQADKIQTGGSETGDGEEQFEMSTVSGTYLSINDAYPARHNLNVTLSSDSITDFSSVTVSRYGSNLFNASQLVNNNTVDNGDGTYTLTRGSNVNTDRYTGYVSVPVPAGVPFVIGAVITENATTSEKILWAELTFTDATKEYVKCTQEAKQSYSYQYDKELSTIRYFVRSDVALEGEYIVFKDPKLNVGSDVAYEEYIAPQAVDASPDGTVSGLTSLDSSNFTLITNNSDVVITSEYQKKK